MAIRGGAAGLDFLATIGLWVLGAGLFFWLMEYGSTYTGYIVQSLQLIGQDAGGTAITPSTVFAAGLNVGGMIWFQNHSVLHPVLTVAILIAILPIVLSFAAAAVWMAVALIEAYFVIGAAVLFLAFGGMRWTREVAVSLLRAVLAIGFKLFAIEMITPVATNLITQWANGADTANMQNILALVGSAFFFAALTKLAPDRLERIVLGAGGSQAHYSHPIREVATAAGVAVGAGATVYGAGTLAIRSVQYALENQTGDNDQASSRVAHGLRIAGSAGAAVARAAGAEIGGRLGGIYRGGVGASAMRISSNIAQQRRVTEAMRNRPQPPSNNPSGGTP